MFAVVLVLFPRAHCTVDDYLHDAECQSQTFWVGLEGQVASGPFCDSLFRENMLCSYWDFFLPYSGANTSHTSKKLKSVQSLGTDVIITSTNLQVIRYIVFFELV